MIRYRGEVVSGKLGLLFAECIEKLCIAFFAEFVGLLGMREAGWGFSDSNKLFLEIRVPGSPQPGFLLHVSRPHNHRSQIYGGVWKLLEKAEALQLIYTQA